MIWLSQDPQKPWLWWAMTIKIKWLKWLLRVTSWNIGATHCFPGALGFSGRFNAVVSSAGHLADESWELSDGSYGCLMMFGYGWPQNWYAQKIGREKPSNIGCISMGIDPTAWAKRLAWSKCWWQGTEASFRNISRSSVFFTEFWCHQAVHFSLSCTINVL